MAKLLKPAATPFERKPHRKAPAARWVGWYRGRGRWQKAVEAQTEKECWRLLLAYRDSGSIECERCVLRAGEVPP